MIAFCQHDFYSLQPHARKVGVDATWVFYLFHDRLEREREGGGGRSAGSGRDGVEEGESG